MTKNKGRGVFAIRDIKKGSILFIEKPIVRMYNKYDISNYSKEEIEELYS